MYNFVDTFVGALALPLVLLRRGILSYISYLTITGIVLRAVGGAIHNLLIGEATRLLTTGVIDVSQHARMKLIIPWFVIILAMPVVLAVLALPVRVLKTEGKLAFSPLIRATPRAVVRAGSATIALAFHSFRLLIPLFLLGLGFIFALETFEPRTTLIGTTLIALGLLPWFWRFGAALGAPIVAVLTESGGRTALRESKRRSLPRLPLIWAIVTLSFTLIALTLTRVDVLALSPNTRCGIVIVLGWYFFTVLTGLLNDPDSPQARSPDFPV